MMEYSFFKRNNLFFWALISLLAVLLSACQSIPQEEKSWNMIEKSAEGTVVNLYLVDNSASEKIESWINDHLKPELAKKSKIELYAKRVPIHEITSLLANDKKHEIQAGKVDLIAVDESHLSSLLKEEFLYADFTDNIYHVKKYIGAEDLDLQYAEDVKLNKTAIPFNKETMLFCYNDDVIYDHPENYREFKELLENKKGVFTYPSAETEIGFKFVKNVILNFTDAKEFLNDLTEEELEALVKPAMDYLQSIEPYLYQRGNYLVRTDEYNDLYAHSKIAIAISDNIRAFDEMVGESIYPENTIAFSMGMTAGKNDYFVIPENSTNKAGAMVVINEALSPSMQSEKYASRHSTGIAPYSHERLSKSVSDSLNKVLKRRTFVKHSDLISKKVHDIPVKYHAKIVEIWKSRFLQTGEPR